MAFSWYIERKDKTLGPYPGGKLKELATSGRLRRTELVRREDQEKPIPAEKIKGLFTEVEVARATVSAGMAPAPDQKQKAGDEHVSPGPRCDLGGPPVGGLGEAVKAAFHLDVAQYRKTQLSKLRLPAAYLHLGRVIFAAGRFRDEFPDLYSQIATSQQERARLAGDQGSGNRQRTLSERRVDAAARLNSRSSARPLLRKEESLLRQLAESSYNCHGSNSGQESLVRPIAESLSSIEELDRKIDRYSQVGQGSLLTPRRILVAAKLGVFLILVGLIAIWDSGKKSTSETGSPALSPLQISPSIPTANRDHAPSADTATGTGGVPSVEKPKTYPVSQAAGRTDGRTSGKGGYIDRLGNIVLPGPFGYAGDFSEGFAAVGAGQASGFLDKSGTMHFAGRFDSSGGFSGGEARVWKGKETFYIDRNEEPVRRHRLEIAQVGGKWGFKDGGGNFVINPQFDLVSEFSDGVSVVSVGKTWGIIDERGEYVLSLQPDKFINTFWRGGKDSGVSEGLLGYRDLNEAIEGYVNTRGKVVIAARFSHAAPFSEGLANVEYWVPQSVIERNWEVMKFDFEPRMGKYGYIDTKGTFVIPPQFDDAQPFSEGIAAVKVGKKDGKWGYIDRSGRFVIDPTFGETLAGFKDGLARIKVGELIGFINRNGKVAIEPQFLDASAFSEGLAAVKFR